MNYSIYFSNNKNILALIIIIFSFFYVFSNNKNILALIIIIFSLFYVFNKININNKINKFDEKYINKLCSRINNTLDEYLQKVYLITNIFSIDECDYIIEKSEEYARINGWKNNRHEKYPTTDNDINNISDLKYFIENRVYNKIIPYYNYFYNIPSDVLGIDEAFIVKYSIGGQKFLAPHIDGSDFSFVIILNDIFEGGNTNFLNLNKTIGGPIGSVIIFCGKNKHQGIEIIKGTRYILTGFLSFKKTRYCDDQRFI